MAKSSSPASVALMSRQAALDRAAAHYDSGRFVAELARLIAVPSESQEARGAPHLAAYLTEHLRPALEHMGFVCRVLVNPVQGGPLAAGRADRGSGSADGSGLRPRRRDPRPRAAWREGLSPWRLSARAAGSTAAAPPTTRASTRSTSPRWARPADPRPARLRRRRPDRDRRGDRLARAARGLHVSRTGSPPMC